MIDKLLQHYKGKLPVDTIAAPTTDEGEPVEDVGAFGWLRGSHNRAIMLELRTKNGNILAVDYHRLDRVEFDPSEGIMLHCGENKIRITGLNLNRDIRPNVRLFEGITRHRVPWIQEVNEPAALHAGKGATVVESIDWS